AIKPFMRIKFCSFPGYSCAPYPKMTSCVGRSQVTTIRCSTDIARFPYCEKPRMHVQAAPFVEEGRDARQAGEPDALPHLFDFFAAAQLVAHLHRLCSERLLHPRRGAELHEVGVKAMAN